MQTIGLHFTIAKGFSYAAKTVSGLGGDTFQFFSRNPRGSRTKTYDEKDIAWFHQFQRERRFGPVLAHAPYTLNLASAREEIRDFSRSVIQEDLARMEALGVKAYNLHPGSHLGQGPEEGIRQIVRGLNQAVRKPEGVMVLLETMSGKGSEVGWRFEQLRQMLDGLEYGSRFGVCMDLCHVYSAGYDIAADLDGVLAEFDRIIGLDRLRAVHLNDSANPFSARKDNHAPLGAGSIGLEATLRVLTHPRMRTLPFYLETPLDDEGHRQEIAMLRRALAPESTD